MTITNRPLAPPPIAIPENWDVGTYTLEGVNEFVYLGSQIRDVNSKIKRIIYPAHRVYCGLRKILTSTVISRETEFLIYKTLL